MEKLNYEQFKIVTSTKLEELLLNSKMPYGYKKEVVRKINTELDSITIIGNDIVAAPTIYFNNLYRQYKENEKLTVDQIAEMAFNMLIEGITSKPYDAIFLDETKESFLSKIIFQVINRKKNEIYLRNVPNRDFMDLSIIYRYVVEINDDEVSSAVVTNKFSEKYDVTEEEMYEAAYKNTMEKIKPGIHQNSMIPGMRFLTNDAGVYGANALLYKEIIAKEAKKIDADLYLIPSSIHEIIIYPVSNTLTADMLKETIEQINSSEIEPEDYLSDSLYIYKKTTDTIEIA